jgi:hypothetical protein
MTLFHVDDSTGKPVQLRLHIPLAAQLWDSGNFSRLWLQRSESPYLYFLRMLLLERGIQVMNVDWDYPGDEDFQLIELSGAGRADRSRHSWPMVRGVGRDKEIRPLYMDRKVNRSHWSPFKH